MKNKAVKSGIITLVLFCVMFSIIWYVVFYPKQKGDANKEQGETVQEYIDKIVDEKISEVQNIENVPQEASEAKESAAEESLAEEVHPLVEEMDKNFEALEEL